MVRAQYKLKKIPVETYAREIKSDLNLLIQQYPEGIYYSTLIEYYGESISRTIKACSILKRNKDVDLYRSVSNAIFILPYGMTPTVPFPVLSGLQRSIVLLILDICTQNKTNRVQTNYSQLARIVKSSYGGLRACLKRLVELEYLQIDNESKRGKQCELIISLGKELQDKKMTIEKHN